MKNYIETSDVTTAKQEIHTWTVWKEKGKIICETSSGAASQPRYIFKDEPGLIHLVNTSSTAFAYVRANEYRTIEKQLMDWASCLDVFIREITKPYEIKIEENAYGTKYQVLYVNRLPGQKENSLKVALEALKRDRRYAAVHKFHTTSDAYIYKPFPTIEEAMTYGGDTIVKALTPAIYEVHRFGPFWSSWGLDYFKEGIDYKRV